MAKRIIKYNRIKEELAKQGKTQGWLAGQLDVEYLTVSRYCNNRRQPSIPRLFEIADALKVSPRELLGR